MILFKILGVTLGLRFAGLAGCAAGFIFGHALDAGISVQIARARYRSAINVANKRKFNENFIASLCSMLSRIAYADGIVNEPELSAFKTILNSHVKLDKRAQPQALALFRQAADSGRGFHSYAVQFLETVQGDRGYCIFAINMMMEMASSDGGINDYEMKLISTAADIFNLSEEFANNYSNNFDSSKNNNKEKKSAFTQKKESASDDCYAILGCKKTDPDSIIKKQYRTLASQYHPDRIASKELAEDFITFANEKFKAIQNAYEQIKRERGLS